MNDRDRRDSGRLMLISPERVFYAGLLGRPRKRSSGGFNIYAAMQGSLKITEGKSEVVGEVALVRPYVPHSIESEHSSIICLVIEPETVEPSAMTGFGARICGAEAPAIAQRIRTAYETLRRQERRSGFTTAEFDQLSFDERLPDRNIDHRIRCAAAMLNDFSGSKMTAADCAASVQLSPSRFLHLFKDQTGISFRAFRAWKRRFFLAQGTWRSTAAIPACATALVSVRGGHNDGAGPAIARGRKKPSGAGRIIRRPAGEDLKRQKADP